MLLIGADDEKILPHASFSNGTTIPDISEWTENALNTMKEEFKSFPEALLYIETIDYYLYKRKPSDAAIEIHLNFVLSLLKTAGNRENLYDRGEEVKLISDWIRIQYVSKELKKKWMPLLFQAEDAIISKDNLFFLESHQMIFDQKTKNRIQEFHKNEFLSLDVYKTPEDITEFCKNKEIASNISKKYFRKLHSAFLQQRGKASGVSLTCLFMAYGIFLIRSKSNKALENKLVDRYLIETRKSWHNFYFHKSSKNGKEFTHCINGLKEAEIKEEQVKCINNPYLFAYNVLFYWPGALLKVLQQIGSTPLLSCVETIKNDPQFPYQRIRKLGQDNVSFLFLCVSNRFSNSPAVGEKTGRKVSPQIPEAATPWSKVSFSLLEL